MALSSPHITEYGGWAHLVLELPQSGQLLVLGVLVRIEDVVVDPRVVQEHRALAELVLLVNSVTLLRLCVGAVGLSLNLVRPCWVIVSYLYLGDTLGIKALAVEGAVH